MRRKTQEMNNKKIKKWINQNPELLHGFDYNKDGIVDELEATTVYALLAEYIKAYEAGSLWVGQNQKGNDIGPLPLLDIPRESVIQVRPAEQDSWLPLELLLTALNKLKPKVQSAAKPSASLRAETTIRRTVRTSSPNRILISTTDEIQGYRIVEHLGLVWGVSARARNAVFDLIASFDQLFGGEISSYTKLAIDTRQAALDRILASAARKGANGIVRLIFDSNSTAQGSSEVVAYGTAVRLVPK
ncbi:MAG: hypothetical protein CMN76_21475 [Spirochaetaceae bacterium]|nr:hypothetical protein [Spirochaetaceae bacterium]|tara:strand:- start:62 stop:796 length:735 start_codon:yes stop_codon:yes gene_type:complete